MSTNSPNPESANAGRRSPGLLSMAVVGLLFGLAMAVAGFLIGRAVAGAPPGAEPALAQAATATTLPSTDVPSTPSPVATEPPPATATVAPTDTLTATPAPSATPTALPPTAPPPTAEVIIGGDSPLSEADFAAFYEAWDIVADQYDGALPPTDELMESAIAGSLEALGDDYTRYVSPEVAERTRQDMGGAVEGIGAMVQENDEGLFEIVRPIDGQPADLAGLQAGDVIVEVDGQSVLEIDFDEVILMVRGPAGTTVNLKVMREGAEEPLEFSIVRARFEVAVVEYEMLPAEMTGGAAIGYIRLTEFGATAEEKLLEALAAILAQQPAGLVFDLRDNPGGYLDQSVAVADAFLPAGVALFERNIRGLDQTFTTDDGDAAEEIPLVVLVNAGSASASEIVAGAIQDRDRAVLVGETTFGKGSVQQIHTLADGGELRVTVARWYTPDNHTIQDEGITPDIEVETPEDLGGPEDSQLVRAIDYILNGQ
ncbi:MAG: S41 family peptidase [Candidatus Promineofilum sp.]|nr:S41 family peptidase [Promineifilum sp.]